MLKKVLSGRGRVLRSTGVQKYLILGGAGLVGKQVCRHIAQQFAPCSIVVTSLFKRDAVKTCEQLKEEFDKDVEFIVDYGNVFGPSQFAQLPRDELLKSSENRKALIKHFYGDFNEAYNESSLKSLLETHRPQVIVDCINTATGVAYQNVFDKTRAILDYLDPEKRKTLHSDEYEAELEMLILSQPVQQLIHHIRILHRATSELEVETYLKVGTTGTGGMGMQLPYTHAEESPSEMLLSKTSSAFAHTGLLFLLARTQFAPVVKELKPAAMIGYGGSGVVQVKDKNMNSKIYVPKEVPNKGVLELVENPNDYVQVGDLRLPVIDTGENGLFSEGEFTCISSYGHMEFLTPEEIAEAVVLELAGANSGYDVIASLDATIMKPSYKAGILRQTVINNVRNQERLDLSDHLPSISIGKLGPPMLSKILFEAYLLKQAFGTFEEIAESDAETMIPKLKEVLSKSVVFKYAPSIGIPILMPEGDALIRGPFINIPPRKTHETSVSLEDTEKVNQWAQRGWIDLRPENLKLWIQRCKLILENLKRRETLNHGRPSAVECTAKSYNDKDFQIGSVAAWILSNEYGGYRIK